MFALLDFKNSQTMILNPGSEEFCSLHQHAMPLKSASTGVDSRPFDLTKVSKLVVDGPQSGNIDDENLKLHLSPSHIQRLLQECVLGFVSTLAKMKPAGRLAQVEESKSDSLSLKPKSESHSTHDSDDSQQRHHKASATGGQTAASKTKGGANRSTVDLGAVTSLLIDLLDHIYHSIQCNHSLDTVPVSAGQPGEDDSRKPWSISMGPSPYLFDRQLTMYQI